MDLSPAITAGAVISGAYFGDKASPLSDTVNLATATAGSQIYDHIREFLWTSISSLVIAIILFAFMGTAGEFDASQLLSGIESKVTVSVWAFLPLLIVLVLSVLRFPPFIAIFIGALAGAVSGILLAPEAVVAFAAAPGLPYALALLKALGFLGHSLLVMWHIPGVQMPTRISATREARRVNDDHACGE